MNPLAFNVSATFGTAATAAGAWLAFGPGPALFALGLLVWATTILVMHFTLQIKGR